MITKESCIELGGHCYSQSPLVMDTMPPTYVRKCKHCGHTQTGRPQESIKWENWN